jgi:hypothetical protein
MSADSPVSQSVAPTTPSNRSPTAVYVASSRKADPSHLLLGRVAALLEEAQPHDVADEPGGHDTRAELVSDLRGSADERLLLIETPPLAGEDPQPESSGYQASVSRAVVRSPSPSWNTAPPVTSRRTCCGAVSQPRIVTSSRGSKPSRPRSHWSRAATSTW